MKTKFSGILTLFLAFIVQISIAQEKTITGIVSDDQGLPLPAATVLIKGTTNGTSTDFDGRYSITANTGQSLVFSYVGYANKEVLISDDAIVNITLAPDNTLEEVIVTAVGIKRKPDEITTAFENVKANSCTALEPASLIWYPEIEIVFQLGIFSLQYSKISVTNFY